jgi:hypothetical protein
MRWVTSYDVDVDVLHYQEVDEAGWMQREVLKFGPAFTLMTATTKFERLRVRRTGRLADYSRTYGDVLAVLERPYVDPAVHVDISGEDFETVWQSARCRVAHRSVSAI